MYFPHAAHWNCPVTDVTDDVTDAVIQLNLHSACVSHFSVSPVHSGTAHKNSNCTGFPSMPQTQLSMMSPSIAALSSA